MQKHRQNVANYNALSAASPDPITQGNPNYDELHYITALGPSLSSSGFPASFIVDQGRSGVQNIRQQWGDWCNIKGAGFGLRPGSATLSTYIDAIVWVKVSKYPFVRRAWSDSSSAARRRVRRHVKLERPTLRFHLLALRREATFSSSRSLVRSVLRGSHQLRQPGFLRSFPLVLLRDCSSWFPD